MSGLVVACAGGPRPRPVTPAEIPALTTQATQQPRNAQIRFRLAAALLAAGRCDSAVVVVANAAEMLAPAEALGPMVVGACQEKDGRYDLAFATYSDFANKYPQARGVPAVRALAQLALRTQATQTAKLALARESTLTSLAPEPATIAVLPMTIAGDSSLQPLSRGLAELVLSDQANGTFKQLLDLEKQLVFGLTSELGIQLTEAERQRILRQGTKNLAAFLAYSKGLEALDRGDYRAAAAAFAQAVHADPSFQQAQQQQQAAEAAPVLQASAGDLVTVIQAVDQNPLPVEPAAEGARKQGRLDVAATIGDVTGQTGINSVLSNPTPESQGISSIVQASGIIRIIFRRP